MKTVYFLASNDQTEFQAVDALNYQVSSFISLFTRFIDIWNSYLDFLFNTLRPSMIRHFTSEKSDFVCNMA